MARPRFPTAVDLLPANPMKNRASCNTSPSSSLVNKPKVGNTSKRHRRRWPSSHRAAFGSTCRRCDPKARTCHTIETFFQKRPAEKGRRRRQSVNWEALFYLHRNFPSPETKSKHDSFLPARVTSKTKARDGEE